MGRKSSSRRQKPLVGTLPPNTQMIFAKLQQVSTQLLPLRRKQIRWECTMAVLIIAMLFGLSILLIPTPYSSMYGLLALLVVFAAIPIGFAWRLLSSEDQILALIAHDQQEKAKLLEKILAQTHLCHVLPDQARVFGVRQVGKGSLPHGPVCVLSLDELKQVQPFIRRSCIHHPEKSPTGSDGLTLVELLGIVAIISILLLIAIPSIMGVIDATHDAALKRRVQTLNFAVEQARLRKYDPVLDSTDKYAVYQYLIDNNFLIKGQGAGNESDSLPDN
jgi:hypothetical protein